MCNHFITAFSCPHWDFNILNSKKWFVIRSHQSIIELSNYHSVNQKDVTNSVYERQLPYRFLFKSSLSILLHLLCGVHLYGSHLLDDSQTFIYPKFNQFCYRFLCRSIYLLIYQSIYLFIYLSIYLSIIHISFFYFRSLQRRVQKKEVKMLN